LNLIAYPKSYSLVSNGMELPVYFISDVHLMDQWSDGETDHQKHLNRFLAHIHSTGGTLFINGDLFDYYFEYKDVIPKGYFPIYNQLYTLKNSNPREAKVSNSFFGSKVGDWNNGKGAIGQNWLN
jgi:hypothetical protein